MTPSGYDLFYNAHDFYRLAFEGNGVSEAENNTPASASKDETECKIPKTWKSLLPVIHSQEDKIPADLNLEVQDNNLSSLTSVSKLKHLQPPCRPLNANRSNSLHNLKEKSTPLKTQRRDDSPKESQKRNQHKFSHFANEKAPQTYVVKHSPLSGIENSKVYQKKNELVPISKKTPQLPTPSCVQKNQGLINHAAKEEKWVNSINDLLPQTEPAEKGLFAHVRDCDLFDTNLSGNLEKKLGSVLEQKERLEEYENFLARCVGLLDGIKGKNILYHGVSLSPKQKKSAELIDKYFKLLSKKIIIKTPLMIELLEKPAKIVLNSPIANSDQAEEIICELLSKHDDVTLNKEVQIINFILKKPPTEKRLLLAKFILQKQIVGINCYEIGFNYLDKEGKDFNYIGLDFLLIWLKKNGAAESKHRSEKCESVLKALETSAIIHDKESFFKYVDACKAISLQDISDSNSLESFHNIYYNLLFWTLNKYGTYFEDKTKALFFFCENILKTQNGCFLIKNKFSKFLSSMGPELSANVCFEAMGKIFDFANTLNASGIGKKNLFKRSNQSLISKVLVQSLLDCFFDCLISYLPTNSDAEDVFMKQVMNFVVRANKEFGFFAKANLLQKIIRFCEKNEWKDEGELNRENLTLITLNSAKKIPRLCEKLDEVDGGPFTLHTLDFFRESIKEGMNEFEFLDNNLKHDAFGNFLDLFRLTFTDNPELLTKGFNLLIGDGNFLLSNEKAVLKIRKMLIFSKKYFKSKPQNFWLHWYALNVILPNDTDHLPEGEFHDENRRLGLILLVNEFLGRRKQWETQRALLAIYKNSSEFAGHSDELLTCYRDIFSSLTKDTDHHAEIYTFWEKWVQYVDWKKFFSGISDKKMLYEFLQNFLVLHQLLTQSKINSVIKDKIKTKFVLEDKLKASRELLCTFFITIKNVYNKNLFRIDDHEDHEIYTKISQNIIKFASSPEIFKLIDTPTAEVLLDLGINFREMLEDSKDKSLNMDSFTNEWKEFMQSASDIKRNPMKKK